MERIISKLRLEEADPENPTNMCKKTVDRIREYKSSNGASVKSN